MSYIRSSLGQTVPVTLDDIVKALVDKLFSISLVKTLLGSVPAIGDIIRNVLKQSIMSKIRSVDEFKKINSFNVDQLSELISNSVMETVYNEGISLAPSDDARDFIINNFSPDSFLYNVTLGSIQYGVKNGINELLKAMNVETTKPASSWDTSSWDTSAQKSQQSGLIGGRVSPMQMQSSKVGSLTKSESQIQQKIFAPKPVTESASKFPVVPLLIAGGVLLLMFMRK